MEGDAGVGGGAVGVGGGGGVGGEAVVVGGGEVAGLGGPLVVDPVDGLVAVAGQAGGVAAGAAGEGVGVGGGEAVVVGGGKVAGLGGPLVEAVGGREAAVALGLAEGGAVAGPVVGGAVHGGHQGGGGVVLGLGEGRGGQGRDNLSRDRRFCGWLFCARCCGSILCVSFHTEHYYLYNLLFIPYLSSKLFT